MLILAVEMKNDARCLKRNILSMFIFSIILSPIITRTKDRIMTSSMETFSVLLAFWAKNSPVYGVFPTQRPVTRSLDVVYDLHLNRQLSKQWRRWWYETLPRSLWRHCNGLLVFVSIITCIFEKTQYIHMYIHTYKLIHILSLYIVGVFLVTYESVNRLKVDLSNGWSPSSPCFQLSRWGHI